MVAPARSRTLVIIGVLVGAILLALAGVAGFTAASPAACVDCHLTGEFADATAATAHAGIECDDCHGGSSVPQRLDFAGAQLFGMWLKVTDVDPSLATVDSARCSACHGDIEGRVLEASGLRILHSSCAVTRECGDCHSATAHGAAESWPRTPTMEMCFECHGEGDAASECDSCHQARLPQERIQTGTFQVTHGPDYLKTHGLAPMTSCVPCHDSSKCEQCHGPGLPHVVGFTAKHGPVAKSPDAQCTGCHLDRFCTDCHGAEMPHPRQYLLDHDELVEAEGEELCRRCHADPDCNECHVRHVHPTTTEQMENMGFGIPGEGAR